MIEVVEKIRPFGNHVVVEPVDVSFDEEEKIIITPDTAQDAPECGIVVAVGPDCERVETGMTVMFGKYSGYAMYDEKLLALREDDLWYELVDVKTTPRKNRRERLEELEDIEGLEDADAEQVGRIITPG